MSHNSGFFPSANGDREYNADDFRKFVMSFVGDGLTRIDGDESGFEVIAENPASMNVVVGKGSAIIKGSWLNPDSDTTISIPTASSSGNRYDAIVLEFNNTVGTRAVTISVVQGTASANPDYPDMIDTDSIKQIPIAYVYVGIGVTSIDDSNIIDNRGTNSCPYASATMDRQELVLPIASNTTLGAIKVGRNLRIEADGTLNATGGGGGGASALSDLEDVDIDFETLASGQALIYDDTDDMWKNQEQETDPPRLSTLPDVKITGSLAYGDILRYNGVKWENVPWDTLPAYGILERTEVDNLSVARYNLASASIGNNALFAGGHNGTNDVDTVDVYNVLLTRSTASPLGAARSKIAGGSIGNYALFAGGLSGSTNLANVDAYDESLTRINAPTLTVAQSNMAGVSLDNHAIFAAGTGASGDAYDGSLVKTNISIPTTAYNTGVGGKVGNNAVFFNNYKERTITVGQYTSKVNDFYRYVYDDSLTLVDNSVTSAGSWQIGTNPVNGSPLTNVSAIYVGNYTMFGISSLLIYDQSMTAVSATAPASTRRGARCLASSLGELGLFGGGLVSNAVIALTSTYDESLVTYESADLLQARQRGTGIKIGNYMLLAGGSDNTDANAYATADAFYKAS